VDGSQVESRLGLLFAYMITKNPELLYQATARPSEFDLHIDTATRIFNKPADQITKDERYLGKKTNHAAWRKMGGKTYSDQLLKDAGIAVTSGQAETWLRAYERRRPEMLDYFRECRLNILRDKKARFDIVFAFRSLNVTEF